jgi:hypothetical protein
MFKISGQGYTLILMDEAYFDGQLDLQKREIVKEDTGGRPMGESSMLKSDYCV